MSKFRKLSAAGLLAGLVATTAAFEAAANDYLGSYVARLSRVDHFASDGYPLDNAAQVVRQDRANVHRFGRADREDDFDPWFRTNAQRARLQNLLQRPGALGPRVRQAIMRGTPLISVDVYRSRVVVRIVE